MLCLRECRILTVDGVECPAKSLANIKDKMATKTANENQIVIDGLKNKKLMITFDYTPEEDPVQAVNDDIFYAEEVEVQDNTVHQEIVETTYPSIDFQNVQSEVIIKNNYPDADGCSYQEVIQSLIPLSDNNEVVAQSSDIASIRNKRKRSDLDDEFPIENAIKVESSPVKNFFGSSMGVSRCPICQKFTKRSNYESHMLEHYSNGAEMPVKYVLPVDDYQPYNVIKQEEVTTATTSGEYYQNNLEMAPNYTEIDEQLKCAVCDYFARSAADFQSHMDSYHSSAVRCSICGIIEADNEALMAHMKTHDHEQAVMTFECAVCNFITYDENEFNHHILDHNDVKPLKCSLCDHVALDPAALKDHLGNHYGDQPYVCPFCEYRSDERTSLVEHVKIHTTEKPQQCPMCDFKCIQKASMKTHMKSHSIESPSKLTYQCNECNFSSKRKNSLIRHQLLHSVDKPYKCPQCNYQSNQKAAYRSHMQRHKGEKPHKCTECNYSSVEKTHLIRHMRQHTGEKPIFCFACDYRCIQFGCLVSHMKRHDGTPIQCVFCNFNTMRSDTIIEHLRMDHKRCWHKMAVQTCTVCGVFVENKERLKFHMSLEHPTPNVNGETEHVFRCAECDFETTNKRYMKSHRKKEHS